MRNYAETVPFRKISTPENQVKLRYFSQCAEKISTAKLPVLSKNFKEDLGFSINSLPQHQTIYVLMTFLGINL